MSGSPDNAAGAKAQVMFYVLWESALTMRRAARQAVTQQLDSYVISVQGPDMTPFSKMDEAVLKQGTYLLLKKTKQKLTPDRVEILRASNSQKIRKLSFYFSKKTASGEDVIRSDEKQLEFGCDTKLARLKTSFDLTKMIGPNGADL